MLEVRSALSAVMGLGLIYWFIAFSAVAAAVYFPKGRRQKALAGAIVVLLFWTMPAKRAFDAYHFSQYKRDAWAHFKKLCAEKAGEKIYKTHTGVKSVLIVKPLPPATDQDHFDQYWYGDPYSASATSSRALTTAGRLTLESRHSRGMHKGLMFVELKYEDHGEVRYQRISSDSRGAYKISVENVAISTFGVSWEDISTPEDRKYWVAGSRLRVIDLTNGGIVGERVGYLIESGFGSRAGGRRPWLTSKGPGTTCPSLIGGDYSDQWFILSVLKHGEGG